MAVKEVEKLTRSENAGHLMDMQDKSMQRKESDRKILKLNKNRNKSKKRSNEMRRSTRIKLTEKERELVLRLKSIIKDNQKVSKLYPSLRFLSRTH